MLSIGKVALGGEDYYLATTASGREQYEGLVEADGVWLGAGAAALGLTGTAVGRDVRRLLQGREPSSGEPLLRHSTWRRVAAYDCTFSVPKSVSLLQAFSPDDHVRQQIRLGHEAAVTATLGYLADSAIAGRTDGVEGRTSVPGDLVGIGFLHRLSRSGDPHLHTHVLVANLVTDPDGGEARTLESTGLFAECRTAGALYETHVRYELTRRLGVEWQPLEGRCWSDLKGVDRGVVREFSQRSNAIAAGLAAEGWQGPAASRLMGELTRPPKDLRRSYEEVLEDAWERLFRAGVSTTRLRDVCHRVPVDRAEAGSAASGGRWKEATLDRLSAGTLDGRFGRGELIRARCSSAPEGRRVDDVLGDTRELLGGGELIDRGSRTVRLRAAGGSFPVARPEAMYTTVGIAATEAQVVELAQSMEHRRPGSVTVDAYPTGGRCGALERLSESVAGWRAEGCSVVAVAPGRLAAASLEASIGADALALPGRWASGRGVLDGVAGRGTSLPPRSVLVLGDAQAYGPTALLGIVRAAAEGEAAVVLLAPGHAVARSPVLSGLQSIQRGRQSPMLGAAPVPGAPVARREADHRFAGVDVTLVGSLGDACDEAVRRLATSAASGRRALVVAADESIVTDLRRRCGLDEGVVHARHLAASGATGLADGGELIVIGGASILRSGSTAKPSQHRSHILVAPGVEPRSAEGLGRAAEAARPGYLVSQLGRPGIGPEERKGWRAAAVGIERYRERWGVRDRVRAFGGPERSQAASPSRASERASVAREAAAVRSGLSREGRTRGGRGLDTLGR